MSGSILPERIVGQWPCCPLRAVGLRRRVCPSCEVRWRRGRKRGRDVPRNWLRKAWRICGDEMTHSLHQNLPYRWPKPVRVIDILLQPLMTVRTASPTPMPPVSPTAPLRIRNKTPSPTRGLSQGTPKDLPQPIVIPPNPHTIRSIDVVIDSQNTPKMAERLASDMPALRTEAPVMSGIDSATLSPIAQIKSTIDAAMPVEGNAVSSPRHLPTPPLAVSADGYAVAPLSPRPQGPRGPVARAQTLGTNIGSARTKLRVVSGNGRRVSTGRETIPLKGGEENEAAPQDTPTILLSKRQHSEDAFSPRKRSPTRSPLALRADDQEVRVAEPLRIPSGGARKPQSRRTSGHNTPRKGSINHRRVSAGTASLISQNTGTSVTEVGATEHRNAMSAIDSTRRNIDESRASVKRLKAEVQGLRKQLVSGVENARPSSTYSNSSLPRSPHRRNINVSEEILTILPGS
jgi:hypothetical protein